MRPRAGDAPPPASRPRAAVCPSCSSSAGGVLFHEACGHGLEADLVDKDAVGVPVASATWLRRRSSRWSTTARTTASGARTRSTTKRTPRSATCSSRTASSPTTCGTWCRAQAPAREQRQRPTGTYQHLPMVRMTNTYLLAGRRRAGRHHRRRRTGSTASRCGGGQVEHRDR